MGAGPDWGDDGLEIAASGNHFDGARALEDDNDVAGQRAILDRHRLSVFTRSNYLVGQGVCDVPSDTRRSCRPVSGEKNRQSGGQARSRDGHRRHEFEGVRRLSR